MLCPPMTVQSASIILLSPPARMLLEDRGVGLIGKADHRERRKRPAAHGINIAERVGGRNLAEGVWIVDNGREEVDRLHERQLGRELIHAGVVGFIEANQHVRVIVAGLISQAPSPAPPDLACSLNPQP